MSAGLSVVTLSMVMDDTPEGMFRMDRIRMDEELFMRDLDDRTRARLQEVEDRFIFGDQS